VQLIVRDLPMKKQPSGPRRRIGRAPGVCREPCSRTGVQPGAALAAGVEPGSDDARVIQAYVPRGFFPTRGEWTWVVTTFHPGWPARVGVQRFPAEEGAAMAPGGPVCDSFHAGDAVKLGTIVATGIDAEADRPWRRVRGTRFVPPGRPASSPVFVEWRHEDGRWVVSSFGEEEEWFEPRPGLVPRIQGARTGPRGTAPHLPMPESERVAAGAVWYQNHEPITVAGARLTMYGLPRPLGENDIVRWGAYDGVALYVEPELLASRVPEVIYLPVDRAGMFQPCQNMTGNGCEH
jgi:hypothetical protein